jgi:hypothetical protein
VLKTTATARLVPTPLVWGTTIKTVGEAESDGEGEEGELERPLQPIRSAANRMAVETLGNCRIDILFLEHHRASSSLATYHCELTVVRAWLWPMRAAALKL